MGEKGNLDPATVAGAAGAGGDSVASSVVDVAASGGQKLSDAVISETTGAVIGAKAAQLKDKDAQPDDGNSDTPDV